MSQKHDLGKIGEELAAKYLINNGFSVLRRNFRYQKTEIDIIARKEDILVVVEVKSRNRDFYEDLSEAVPTKKRKRIVVAADYFVQEQQLDLEVRFDIISVVQKGNNFVIEHLPDAFYHF